MKHWKLKVIDMAIEYYDGCVGECEGMCTTLCRLSPRRYASDDRTHSEEWYSKYIEMLRPDDEDQGYFWHRDTVEGVECRQIAIRLIRYMVEDDILKKVK